ncbi:MAG: selenium cofactor biosynthesis protein YqeC, partial [Candidatus Choladocola sp.]|nr:selenium cofactor biosynthesis protein YqeC [Candidatus Choladocola sp.]
HVLELLYELKKRSRLECVIVVTQYEEIFHHIQENFPGVETVRNPSPERGISGSIRLGLDYLGRISSRSEGCLFAVADQPYLTLDSLIRLQQLWMDGKRGIAAASCRGKSGNPVIFNSRYYDSLRKLEGDKGGKQVLRSYPEDTQYCEFPPEELRDYDTPEDMILETWFPFLRENGHVISIVGAGGKTTVMYTLARYFARNGRKALVTTTTHIEQPIGYPLAGNQDELLHFFSKELIVVAGTPSPENKLTASGKMKIHDYLLAADAVLVEADGAKHYPCKVPRDGEPVIPDESDIVIAVMGISALGQPLEKVCFRKEQSQKLLDVREDHCMTEEDLAFILSSELGTAKNVGDRSYYIVLNQCDGEEERQRGEQIRKLLLDRGFEHTVCASFHQFYRPLEEES